MSENGLWSREGLVLMPRPGFHTFTSQMPKDASSVHEDRGKQPPKQPLQVLGSPGWGGLQDLVARGLHFTWVYTLSLEVLPETHPLAEANNISREASPPLAGVRGGARWPETLCVLRVLRP